MPLGWAAARAERDRGERRQPGRRPTGRPGNQLRRSGLPHQAPPLVGVAGRQQRGDRDIGEGRIAVPGLPVGERQLGALDHGVDVLGGLHRRQLEARQQRELLQEDRALAPGLRLADGQARVLQGERGLGPRLPRGEVVVAEQAAVAPPGPVQHLGDVEVAGERLGHEPLVEHPPGGLDLLVPVSRGGFGLVEDALVGGGQPRVTEPGPRRGHLPARQVHLRGAGPVVAEHLRHAGDGTADRRDERIAAPGVLDRVAQHVPQAGDAVVAKQEQPGAERPGHAGREQAVARDQVDAERAERAGRRRPRGRALPADHERPTAPGVEADDRDLTARAGQVRLDDLQDQPGSDRRVERVAALLQHSHPGGRGEPVGRGDHAERASQLRPGGELTGCRHAYPPRPLALLPFPSSPQICPRDMP